MKDFLSLPVVYLTKKLFKPLLYWSVYGGVGVSLTWLFACEFSITPEEKAAKPDLTVLNPSITPLVLSVGEDFTLSVTVTNEGTAPADSYRLTYYRGANATLSARRDEVVGSNLVLASLKAQAASNHTLDLTAPTSEGDYYYGACVSEVTNESSTINNCSRGRLVTIVLPPDVVVNTPTVSTNTVPAGGTFTLSVTVSNEGLGNADSTTITYYRSDDSTITTNDTSLGSNVVPSLISGATSRYSKPLAFPDSGSSYYYGACVSVAYKETNTANNCSTGVMVVKLE